MLVNGRAIKNPTSNSTPMPIKTMQAIKPLEKVKA